MPSLADASVLEVVRFPSAGLLLEGRFAYPDAGMPVGSVVISRSSGTRRMWPRSRSTRWTWLPPLKRCKK